MLEMFFKGGHPMWLLLFLLIIIIIISVIKAITLFVIKNTNTKQSARGINAIIFWGSFSMLFGFFAHFFGLYQAMNGIKYASDISPAIVAEGYAVSIISILFGILIFLLSATIWFIFRWRIKKLNLNL